MNKLEQIMFYAVKKAHHDYYKMSGWWLSHGPESFLQTVIAQEIASTGYFVHVDVSSNKLKKDHSKMKTKQKIHGNKRVDIAIWDKKESILRAAIEIKKTQDSSLIVKDVKKLKGFLIGKNYAETGYVIAYSEASSKKHETTLDKRFKDWSDATQCKLLSKHIEPLNTEIEPDWGWGFCILKVEPNTKND